MPARDSGGYLLPGCAKADSEGYQEYLSDGDLRGSGLVAAAGWALKAFCVSRRSACSVSTSLPSLAMLEW